MLVDDIFGASPILDVAKNYLNDEPFAEGRVGRGKEFYT